MTLQEGALEFAFPGVGDVTRLDAQDRATVNEYNMSKDCKPTSSFTTNSRPKRATAIPFCI